MNPIIVDFFAKILIFILKVLIKIGDSVIFLVKLIIGFTRKITNFLTSITAFFLKNYNKSRSFVKFKTSISFPKKAEIYKKVSPKNKKKTIFPLPFIIKFRYFIWGLVFSTLFIFFPLLFILFLQSLPNPRELALRDIPQTTKIYDRNHTLLYQIYATENRTIVPLSDMPKDLQNATIAIEDKDFYNHPGFDLTAIARSIVKDLSQKDLQGGSTITQQLIKSALLSPEPKISRKIKELVLAFWAERIYTKKQILEMYLNQVPYGGTAWGAEAASEVYFGKSVKDLDLAQSAFLAGIPRAPSIYSPYGENPDLWKKRQTEVLKKMYELGYITAGERKKAEDEELNFASPKIPIYAPHFVMYIKDFLENKYGLATVEKGGLTVITSLDLKLQDKAQKIVTDEVEKNSYLNLTNGAALITNPKNGDILAMVGSKDFYEPTSGNVNLTTSLRQPGSSIKIVTYSAALNHGYTAATILSDTPVSYTSGGETYSPVNYDGRFHGNVPLRIAFANSFNIPAVKLVRQLGVPTIVDYAKRMGITTWGDPSKYGLSITLGSAEVRMVDMATVYGTIANGGEKVEVNPIIKITDYKGNVLEEKKDNDIPKERILDEGIAYILTSILSDNQARSIEFGTNSPLQIKNKTVAVKTGTSDNKRDNWTIGYTPSHLVAVWVGNNNNAPMNPALASGITGAAPIWNGIMSFLLEQKPDEKLPIPADIVQKQCFGRSEYFLKGTETISCSPLPTATPSASLTPIPSR